MFQQSGVNVEALIKKDRTWLWLAGSLFLFVFAKFWEPGVGISTTTYGAFARDMLENGNWFKPVLGPGLYEPFVDHPYLVLWLDAVFFKLFGISAQTIRLSASILGIIGFISLFGAVKNLLDEKTALWSCILLMTVNLYMNYHSSGWLDMPMIGLSLAAFYFVSKGPTLSATDGFFAGLLLAGALLSKGVAALAIGPIFIFALYRSKNRSRDFVIVSLGFLLPVAAFTLAHYVSQGFFFWSAYFQRQFLAQNNVGNQLSSWKSYFWYLGDVLKHGHILAVLCLPGIYFLFKRGQNALGAFILGMILVHFLAYSHSSRHYTQYALPLFPWLAVATAFLLTSFWKMKISAQHAAKRLFAFAVVFFITIEILPVKVHSASGKEFKAFQAELYDSTEITTIYFEGELADQDSWEGPASYIRWYLNKKPVMISRSKIDEVLGLLRTDEALILATGESSRDGACLQSPGLQLFFAPGVCKDSKAKERDFSDEIRYQP